MIYRNRKFLRIINESSVFKLKAETISTPVNIMPTIVQVEINTTSVDSNHAERDKHLRGEDFLDVSNYPKAQFESTDFKSNGEGGGLLMGNLTLHGATNPVIIDVQYMGHGSDPWGGYRRGFGGTTRISLEDYGINYNLGPKSREVELMLFIEGIRQKGQPPS